MCVCAWVGLCVYVYCVCYTANIYICSTSTYNINITLFDNGARVTLLNAKLNVHNYPKLLNNEHIKCLLHPKYTKCKIHNHKSLTFHLLVHNYNKSLTFHLLVNITKSSNRKLNKQT